VVNQSRWRCEEEDDLLLYYDASMAKSNLEKGIMREIVRQSVNLYHRKQHQE
jgi:hypothetical protein